MKKIYRLVVILVFTSLFTACEKEGCTDCVATNFDPSAEKDDNSCNYENLGVEGVYVVSDSTTSPPTLEWYYDTYEIELTRQECSASEFRIKNYANKNNSFASTVFEVNAQLNKGEIDIPAQTVGGEEVRKGSGRLVGDSIFFSIEYVNELGEVFYGDCYGVKK